MREENYLSSREEPYRGERTFLSSVLPGGLLQARANQIAGVIQEGGQECPRLPQALTFFLRSRHKG
jgi:hypothetical protein